MTGRYVSATRDRFRRPRNTKRWYRCRCGRWWGVNKRCFCTCGALPPSAQATAKHQAEWDHEWARRLDLLGHHEDAAYVRGFLR